MKYKGVESPGPSWAYRLLGKAFAVCTTLVPVAGAWVAYEANSWFGVLMCSIAIFGFGLGWMLLHSYVALEKQLEKYKGNEDA